MQSLNFKARLERGEKTVFPMKRSTELKSKTNAQNVKSCSSKSVSF